MEETLLKAIHSLNEGVAALETPMRDLIDASNKTSRLLEQQNEALQELTKQLRLQNARMDLLTTTVSQAIEDPALKRVYAKLTQRVMEG